MEATGVGGGGHGIGEDSNPVINWETGLYAQPQAASDVGIQLMYVKTLSTD